MATLDRITLEIANYVNRFGRDALKNVDNLRTYLIRRGLPAQNVNQAIEAMRSYVNPAIESSRFQPPMNVYQGQGVALNAPSTAITTTSGGAPSPVSGTSLIQTPSGGVPQSLNVVDDVVDVVPENVTSNTNAGNNVRQITTSAGKAAGSAGKTAGNVASRAKDIAAKVAGRGAVGTRYAANAARFGALSNPLTATGLTAITLAMSPPVQGLLRGVGNLAGQAYYNLTDGQIDPLQATTRTEIAAKELAQQGSQAKAPTKKNDATRENAATISPQGIQAIKNEEGFRDKAYQDSKGVWTIGYGRTSGVKKGDTTTREAEDAWLARDTARRVQEVLDVVKVPLTQGQLDALVSLQYNIGQGQFADSTLVEKLNKGDYKGAANEFARWNKIVHDDGRVEALEGLTKRRARELAMFNSNVPIASQDVAQPKSENQVANTQTATQQSTQNTTQQSTQQSTQQPTPLQWFELLQSVYGTGNVANAQDAGTNMGIAAPQQTQQFVAQEPQLTQTEQMMIQALQPRQNNVMADIKDLYAMSQNAIMNSDPRYQGGVVPAQGYYVDPAALASGIRYEAIRNGQLGSPETRLRLAQAQYEANIANQAGVPYADYRAAMLERQKQLVANQQAMIEQALTYQLGMEQNDVKRAEIIQKIYDTRATAQNKLNEIQAQGMVDRDIEMRKAFGDFITKQAENDANLQQEAIKGQWDAYNKQLELNNPYYQAGKLGSFYSGTGLGLTNPQAVQNMIQAQDPNLMKQLYPQANAQTFQTGMQPQRTQANQAGLYGMMQNALQNMRQGQQN